MISQLPSFTEVAEFHGHRCPGLAMGYRVAAAALDWASEERAPDEELVMVAENRSCAVDALQVILGTTAGKGNLLFREYGKHGYTVYRRSDGEGRRFFLRIPEEWRGLDRPEMITRLLEGPQDDVITAEAPREPLPPKARMEPSEPCAICGEPTMRSALILKEGRRLCAACARESTA